MTVILISSMTIMKREKLQKRPLGTVLRDLGDKTDQVYELASNRWKFCLAHPSRFGKSLLLSIFESLFRHGLRDFRGLAIEDLWDEEKTYLVVRIDFTETIGFSDFSSFSEKLRSVLVSAFGKAGFVYDPCSRMPVELALSDWLKTLKDNSLVLLIDEYDAPLLDCFDHEALFVQVRRELSSFYAVMKSNDAPLRFWFVTGSKTVNEIGIYPELNHLLDLSRRFDFTKLPGFGREEAEGSCEA